MRMSEPGQLSLVIVDDRLRVDGVLDFTTAAADGTDAGKLHCRLARVFYS